TSRHLASGLRRQVPVPVHGASMKTRSKLPAWRFTHLSRSPVSTRRWTMLIPARRRRCVARSRRFSETSQATKWPRLFIAAAIASVLPPAPAQKWGEPGWVVPPHVVRHRRMLERLIDERGNQCPLGGRQPFRTEAVAIAGALDLRRRPALDENEGGEETAARIGCERAAAQSL